MALSPSSQAVTNRCSSWLVDRAACETALEKALKAYSRKRASEARVLVALSRSFDRSGVAGLLSFILPLILDGIFHGAAPALFAPQSRECARV